ncbi:hypothetical protein CL645_01635 [bacterium]|nr:hypothetical protein [bacterium]|tara:strand:- start:2395 stop:2604 length:210 start_codon:yes stop_codon:yes gene_type:complete
MKKFLLALCVPILGLASFNGLIAIACSFIASNLFDSFWLGKGLWVLPASFYLFFYYLISFVKFKREKAD